MAKPEITFRSVKDAALNYTELDTNFQNLRDATIGFTVGGTTADIDLNSSLTVVAGSNISLSLNPSTDTLTISSTAAGGNAFGRIIVAGSADVVADSASDTLTLVAGTGISIGQNANTDTITINSTVSSSNSFATIAVAGQSSVVADNSADTLTLVAGTGIQLQTDASTDTVTINYTGAVSGALTNVVEDLTPQLGGDLDVNGKNITSNSGVNLRLLSSGGDGNAKLILDNDAWPKVKGFSQYLAVGASSGGITTLEWQTLDISRDTSPELGGNLDTKGTTISDSTIGQVFINSNLVFNSNSISTIAGTSDNTGISIKNTINGNAVLTLTSGRIAVTGDITGPGGANPTLTLRNTVGGSGIVLQASGVYPTAPIAFAQVTTTQRNSLAVKVAGMVIWNTTTTRLQVYDGTDWQDLH